MHATSVCSAALVLAAGCTSVPERVEQHFPFSGFGGSLFFEPVLLRNVEFNVEIEEEGSRVGVSPLTGEIVWDGVPLVRALTYSWFEVAGKKHHFPKGAKVYIFVPRPKGELRMNYLDMPLELTTEPETPFLLSLYDTPEGRILKFGRAELRHLAPHVYFPDGTPLTEAQVRRGVRMTKRGSVLPL